MAGMTDSGDGGNDRLIIDAVTACDNAEEVVTLCPIALVLLLYESSAILLRRS